MNKTKAQPKKPNPETDNQIKAFLDFFNPERITSDDLRKGVQMLVDYAKNIETNNTNEFAALKTALQNVLARIKNEGSQELKKNIAEIHALTQKTLAEIRSEGNSFGSTLEKKLFNALNSSLSKEKGERMTEIEIIRAALSQIHEEETPETIKEKLESLIPEDGEEEDGRLDISAIKGVEKLLKKVIAEMGGHNVITPGGGGAGERRSVQYYDLSPSLDGVTKTFSLPAFYKVLDVKLSSVPVMRFTTDYTVDGTLMKITFTSEINADTDLAVGQSCIILYSE